MISQDELLLLMRDWRDKQLPIRIVAKLSTGYFSIFCILYDCDSEIAAFKIDGGGSICEFVLHGFNFEYAEPRTKEAQEEVIDGRTWTAALMGLRSIGTGGKFEELIFMADLGNDK